MGNLWNLAASPRSETFGERNQLFGERNLALTTHESPKPSDGLGLSLVWLF